MTNSSEGEPNISEVIALLPPSQQGGRAILESLWQKLRPANPVRQIARKVIGGGAERGAAEYGGYEDGRVTRADAERLLDTLEQTRAKPLWSREVVFWLLGGSHVSPEHTEREAAVWTLAHLCLPPDLQARAGVALAHILAGEGLRNRQNDPVAVGRGFLRGVLLFAAASPLMFPAIGGMRNPTLLQEMALIAMMVGSYAGFFSPLFIGIATKQNGDHLSRLQFAAATALGPLVRPEAAYALAKAAGEKSKDNLPYAALHSLKATLSAISPEHYGTLPAATVPNLSALLHPSGDAETNLQILHTLEKVGDGRAVAPVQKFARRAQGVAEAAAQRILPISTLR